MHNKSFFRLCHVGSCHPLHLIAVYKEQLKKSKGRFGKRTKGVEQLPNAGHLCRLELFNSEERKSTDKNKCVID